MLICKLECCERIREHRENLVIIVLRLRPLGTLLEPSLGSKNTDGRRRLTVLIYQRRGCGSSFVHVYVQYMPNIRDMRHLLDTQQETSIYDVGIVKLNTMK